MKYHLHICFNHWVDLENATLCLCHDFENNSAESRAFHICEPVVSLRYLRFTFFTLFKKIVTNNQYNV